MRTWWMAVGILALLACGDDSSNSDEFFVMSDFEPSEGSRILEDDTLTGAFVWNILDSNFTPTRYYLRLMFHDQDGNFTVPDTLNLSHYYPVKSDSGSGVYTAAAADAYADPNFGRPIRCRYELVRVIDNAVEVLNTSKTLRYSE